MPTVIHLCYVNLNRRSQIIMLLLGSFGTEHNISDRFVLQKFTRQKRYSGFWVYKPLDFSLSDFRAWFVKCKSDCFILRLSQTKTPTTRGQSAVRLCMKYSTNMHSVWAAINSVIFGVNFQRTLKAKWITGIFWRFSPREQMLYEWHPRHPLSHAIEGWARRFRIFTSLCLLKRFHSPHQLNPKGFFSSQALFTLTSLPWYVLVLPWY